jgi:hypothetical protein
VSRGQTGFFHNKSGTAAQTAYIIELAAGKKLAEIVGLEKI